MEKVIYSVFVLALVLMLSACNDGTVNSTESTLEPTNNTIAGNLLKTEAQVRNAKTIVIDPGKDRSFYIGDSKAIERAKAIPMSAWEGPFQATAVRSVKFEDVQHFVDYVPGVASALYWVDFLKYRATATIPSGSVAYVEDPTPVGWRDIINRIPGIRTDQFFGTSHTTIGMETYSVYIKHNVAGQSIDVEYPNGLIDGFEYTYYYIEQP